MKKLLILKHAENEGTGTLGDYFKNAGWNLREVELYSGMRAPERLDNIDAVVCMGGPMNVYEDDRYPFLKYEDAFIKQVLKEGVPYIGICLGAQLLAKASGARVKKAEVKEIGWGKINLTPEGAKDPLFSLLPQELDVFQWHEDTFELPRNSTLIAQGTLCKNQGFRSGKNAYGLQFHVEVIRSMIASWLDGTGGNGIDAEAILSETGRREGPLRETAGIMYKNFKQIVESSLKTVA